MDKLDELLYEKRDEIDRLRAPEDMEARLKNALHTRRRRFGKSVVAIAAVLALMLTYSFDALSYYGGKILGYDSVVYGSIKGLNEEGRGQIIDKSVKFAGGLEVTLDGVMFDDNEFIAFYSVHGEEAVSGKATLLLGIKGLRPMMYNMKGGTGSISSPDTENWITNFEPVDFYEKWLTLDIRLLHDGTMEEGKISFTLDRGKALKRTVRQNINKKVVLKDYEVNFESISASPLSTIVGGSYLNLAPEGKEAGKAPSLSGEEPRLEFTLAADGNPGFGLHVAGTESKNGATAFQNSFNALPSGVKSLKIKDIRFSTIKMIDNETDISLETANLKIADDLTINKLWAEDGITYVSVHTSGFPGIGLFVSGSQAAGLDDSAYDRDGGNNAAYLPTDRIYRFKGTGSDMKLMVKYIKYANCSDEVIDIPID